MMSKASRVYLLTIWVSITLLPLALTGCSSPPPPGSPFSYAVLIQDGNSRAVIRGANITIYVENLASLTEISDNTGYARFQIPSSHSGKPGRLKVEMKDYSVYDRAIDLMPNRLPAVISLSPSDVTGPATAGEWRYERKKISVGGRLFDSYGYIDSRFATLDIQGWEGFTGFIGIADDTSQDANDMVTIEVDGKVIKELQVNHGEAPVPINIPLRGSKLLTIRRQSGNSGVVIGDPKWVQKMPIPSPSPTREELRLGSNTKVVSGSWRYYLGSTTINGKLIKPVGSMDGLFVTFDVEGWDFFSGEVGITDADNPYSNDTFTVMLDGQEIQTLQLNYGERPVSLNIPLRGHRALTLRRGNIHSYVAIGDPKLTRGN